MLRNLFFTLLFVLSLSSDTTKIKEDIKYDNADFQTSQSNGKTDGQIPIDKIMTFVNTGKFLMAHPTVSGIVLGSVIVFLGNEGRKYFIKQNDGDFDDVWENEKNEFINEKVNEIKIKYKESEEKINEDIYKEEIKSLSTILNEEKKELILEYVMNYISSNIIEEIIKNLTHINILSLGASQIGKTTLINDILFLEGDERGKEGGEGVSTRKEDKIIIQKF